MVRLKVYKTTGGCMRPLIKNSQYLFIIPQKKIKRGDLVLYRVEDKNFLHRVKEVKKDKVVFIDDTGIISSVEVSLDNVVGIYPTVLSGWVGYIYSFFSRNVFSLLRKIKIYILSNFRPVKNCSKETNPRIKIAR
ncbi:MAG: S24 family peptidase [Endomicrobiia bacterium]